MSTCASMRGGLVFLAIFGFCFSRSSGAEKAAPQVVQVGEERGCQEGRGDSD